MSEISINEIKGKVDRLRDEIVRIGTDEKEHRHDDRQRLMIIESSLDLALEHAGRIK